MTDMTTERESLTGDPDYTGHVVGGEDAPDGLTHDEHYVWARINLGYPVARTDKAIVDSIRAKGAMPKGAVAFDLYGRPV